MIQATKSSFSARLWAILPEPEVSMVRYGVNAGTRFALADANLADFGEAQLTSILLENDIEKVLDALREALKVQGQLMLVELVPPEAESPVVTAPGESTAEVNAKLAEARQIVDREGLTTSDRRRGKLGAVLRWGLSRSGLALCRGARRGEPFVPALPALAGSGPRTRERGWNGHLGGFADSAGAGWRGRLVLGVTYRRDRI